MERTGKSEGQLGTFGRNSSALALRNFIDFLQCLFSDGTFGYRWLEDQDKTDIVIQEAPLDGNVDVDKLRKLPAIQVFEGSAYWVNINSAAVRKEGDSIRNIHSPTNFSLVIQVISDDSDEMKDVASMVFTALPLFAAMIGKRTGLAIISAPQRRYSPFKTESGVNCSIGIIEIPCSVTVSLEVTPEVSSIFDKLIRSGTMQMTSAVSEGRAPTFGGSILGNTPKDMIDVVLSRVNAGRDVPDKEVGTIEQTVEMLED